MTPSAGMATSPTLAPVRPGLSSSTVSGISALGAVVISLLVGVVLVMTAGAPASAVVPRFLEGIVGSRFNMLEVLVTATPLIFTGLTAVVAFQGRFFNIGADGQFLAGGIAATALALNSMMLPASLIIPLCLIAGGIGGTLWLMLPFLLKARFEVNEVVSTLLMNFIALLIVSMLVLHVWVNPVETNVSTSLPNAALLPRVSGSRLHAGFLVALVAAVTMWMVMNRTMVGLRIKWIGSNSVTARALGVRTVRTALSLAVFSGAIAGIGGAIQAMGIQHHLSTSLSNGFGFTGVVVAMLARLNPLGVVLAATFLAAVANGTSNLSRTTSVPSYLSDVIGALILLLTLGLPPVVTAMDRRIRRG